VPVWRNSQVPKKPENKCIKLKKRYSTGGKEKTKIEIYRTCGTEVTGE
jgi:hypothetical protein